MAGARGLYYCATLILFGELAFGLLLRARLPIILPQSSRGAQVNAENINGNLAGGLFISGGSNNVIGLEVDFEGGIPSAQNPGLPGTFPDALVAFTA